MDAFAAVDASADEFFRRLAQVGPGDWDRPTPCVEWDVSALVAHVIRGARLYRLMLSGAAPDEMAAARTAAVALDHPDAAFADARAALMDAFRAEEDLERAVPHPAGPQAVREIMRMRAAELTVHAWDLARAIGAYEALNPDLVDFVLAWMSSRPGLWPRHFPPAIPPAPDASASERMLLLAGRRP